VRIWKLGAKPGPPSIQGPYVDKALSNGFAAIGWARLGHLGTKSPEEILRSMRKKGYDENLARAKEAWLFSHPNEGGIQKNDLVLLYCEPSRVCVGRVTRAYHRVRRGNPRTDYFSREFGEDYVPHRIGIKWLFRKKRFFAKFWYWPQVVFPVSPKLLDKVRIDKHLKTFLLKQESAETGSKGGRMISITEEGWGPDPPRDPQEAAEGIFGRTLYYTLTGDYKHLDLEKGEVLVFRFQGKLLGERKFERWGEGEVGQMVCTGGFQYPIFLRASEYIVPGRNPYPNISEQSLSRIRKDAQRTSRGPYMKTGEKQGPTTHRIGQAKVREDALRRYGSECSLCGMDAEPVLVAGHIKGWAEDARPRGEPSNVILMCALHDSLFGKGLITLAPRTYKVQYSPELTDEATRLLRTLTRRFRPPASGPPATEFLKWHNQEIFRK
jgi:hypothetical protein